MFKVLPWDVYLQDGGFCLTCLGMLYGIEVTVTQMTFQTFFCTELKGAAQASLSPIG